MIRLLSWLSLFLILWPGIPLFSEGDDPFSIEFPAIFQTGEKSEHLLFRIFFHNENDLEELLLNRGYRIKKDGDDGSIVIQSDRYHPITNGEFNSVPTFLLDFDAAPFLEIKKEIIHTFGKKPSPADLTSYTNGYIEKKNLSRGFDIASTVAKSRTGDCTEHAVFLAALLRMFGYPSQITVGYVVHKYPSGWKILGHAWVEYTADGGYYAADAAMNQEVDRAYLPLSNWKNEGVSYGMEMMRMVNRFPSRMIISGFE